MRGTGVPTRIATHENPTAPESGARSARASGNCPKSRQTWAFLSTREAEEDSHLHAIALEGWRLKPGGPQFIIELTFDPGTDAAKVVTFVDRTIFD